MKMEQTECSETPAYKIQTPGNYPKEIIQHSEHGESLKSRTIHCTLKFIILEKVLMHYFPTVLCENLNNNIPLTTNKWYIFGQTGLFYKKQVQKIEYIKTKRFFPSNTATNFLYFNITACFGRKRPSWVTITKYLCTGIPMMVVIHRHIQKICGRVPRKKDVLFYFILYIP
jgi:hypothetical protein